MRSSQGLARYATPLDKAPASCRRLQAQKTGDTGSAKPERAHGTPLALEDPTSSQLSFPDCRDCADSIDHGKKSAPALSLGAQSHLALAAHFCPALIVASSRITIEGR
ncbi:hypothetical protein CDEST_04999 [Colletotrichum destructivum]|uniref:Uncharacterized protein n=1 Tax=Colletotrichum destructivum TaxID=34406 RepID=A0AAX4I9J5_9PEZI|nr:hypothetical protein CDEST_04999 [Colletotrichum destructivum]